jgi:hypothetical protein
MSGICLLSNLTCIDRSVAKVATDNQVAATTNFTDQLSLTSIFGGRLGVIDTIILVSIILLCFLSLISFVTYFFLQFMALCSCKVSSEINSA